MSFDRREFRQTLGRYATGVTAITTFWQGQSYGMTANSFTSVSLEPPLVLFCAHPLGRTPQAIVSAGVFGVNIFSAHQMDVCKRLAGMTAIEEEDRFLGLEHTLSPGSGVPWLADCMAWLDCTLRQTWEAGDHIVLLGEVTHLRNGSEREPLLFYEGQWPTIQRASGGVG